MAQEPGKKGSILFAAGRFVGFAALAGVGIAILAGVVLLPPYQRMLQAQYERDCLRAENADCQTLIAAYERFIKALPEDEVLMKRLAGSHIGLKPSNEVVSPAFGHMGASVPGVIIPKQTPRPAPPDKFISTLSARVEEPSTRRGAFVLAIAAMLTALFLFSPPEKYRTAGNQ